jgi:inosose dehydratase
MNSDFPSLGQGLTVEQCLSEIALIGFRAVEMEDPLREALEQRPQLLEERGLELAAGWHGTLFLENSWDEEIEQLDRHIELIKRYGARTVNIAEVSGAIHRDPTRPLSERPRLSELEWERLCLCLERAAQHVARRGLQTAYHHHMGTCVQDLGDIEQLMARTKSLGLLFDTGHLVFAEVDPEHLLSDYVERITHVHMKNVRRAVLEQHIEADASFLQAVLAGSFTVPGDQGTDRRDGLDFYPLLETLYRAGYQGDVVMEAEQNPAIAHPLSYARLGYLSLKLALSQLRLEEWTASTALAEV